jgi:hypothetical protein
MGRVNHRGRPHSAMANAPMTHDLTRSALIKGARIRQGMHVQKDGQHPMLRVFQPIKRLQSDKFMLASDTGMQTADSTPR